ncbi:hypothetical protein TIFTF001_001587 [Ficus carica]|uniref:Uncharacterized protein n=1 Tax=Ficus carica TaxID=3494 RepID=A0AA87Z2F4_FICCA|nr:hypothetical protein TIFTF001_001587 [Ficus carica]
MDTTAMTSTTTALRSLASVSTSESRSPRRDQSRPLQITISTARSIATPPDRDLPDEICHDLLPIVIFPARSVATSMLKIAMPTRSWFMPPSYFRHRHHRCQDFRPTRRET